MTSAYVPEDPPDETMTPLERGLRVLAVIMVAVVVTVAVVW